MIVIGGSLGGCDALHEILVRLPASFPCPIAVALHRHRESEGMIAPILQRGNALPVTEVEDKDPIQPGRVYLCPSDYHLLIDRDCFALSTDELVNFARPAIDVLFESAAEWYAEKAVAVLLTGSGADGARGVRAIEDRGGTVIVQDPKTAEGPWMPTAAIAATQRPQVLTLTEIAAALIALTREPR